MLDNRYNEANFGHTNLGQECDFFEVEDFIFSV